MHRHGPTRAESYFDLFFHSKLQRDMSPTPFPSRL